MPSGAQGPRGAGGHGRYSRGRQRCPQPAACGADLAQPGSCGEVRRTALQRGKADGCFPVLWVVKIDPVRRCCHINYISAEDSFHAEDELPFAAGSVFDVEEVDWAPPASGRPSRIVIRAAPDNKQHPLDLPG
eukprot:TRINITY_DN4907_c0_g1_i1.p4 TRINITY_DN4907_c0_g1~~TRINITY_DN4907_c0_g1_i1.p4  ORF type:complete len:133 (+),score=15.94 TRINITY_DN4907_c0_g1_i1:181-579(+)